MKKQNIILLLAVAIGLVTLYLTFSEGNDQTAYIKKIEKEREERDQRMRNGSDSPFAGKVEQYKGLTYYEPNIKYKITADFHPIQNKKVVMLGTSDGKQERYLEYAYAQFDLDGYNNKLLILEMIDPGPNRGRLFLAFGDATSAMETYGAGRYLDVNKVQGSNTITLDFNQAYNPYCAYDDSFSCPLPPSENLLRIAIRAGEKDYLH
jgi:uncharacterized protein (DUF1684 family)